MQPMEEIKILPNVFSNLLQIFSDEKRKNEEDHHYLRMLKKAKRQSISK